MNPKEEGRRHFRQYGTDYRNPYPIGSNEYNEFERGWSQELKARPELIEELNRKNALRKKEGGPDLVVDQKAHAAAVKAYRDRSGK